MIPNLEAKCCTPCFARFRGQWLRLDGDSLLTDPPRASEYRGFRDALLSGIIRANLMQRGEPDK